MRRVSVSIFGKDMLVHTLEVDAASLFDAAHQAIQQWSMFWWHNPEALLTIESGPDRWKVNGARKSALS